MQRLSAWMLVLACGACSSTHTPPASEPPPASDGGIMLDASDLSEPPPQPGVDAGAIDASEAPSEPIPDAAPIDDASVPAPVPPVACAFEPIDPDLVVDNPRCPNGIYEGDAAIASSDDIAALAGCTRVRGSVEVVSETLESLAGLEALRVIEGWLSVPGRICPPRMECIEPNPRLRSLAGLENLACVTGDVDIRSMSPIELSGLGALREVGGSLLIVLQGEVADPDRLQQLERVFGDVLVFGVETPHLQTIYGGLQADTRVPSATYVGCAPGTTPCRDGILGCDYYVGTQAELATLSTCVVALKTIGVSAADATSLEALRNLRRVGMGLSISGASLPSLAGLEDFEAAFSVHLSEVPKLQDISALGGVELMTLTIDGAPIESLEALGLVRFPEVSEQSNGPALLLYNLPLLTELGDLWWLTQLDMLEITGTSLSDLRGLEALESIRYGLVLNDNPKLTSLRALSALTALRDVHIERNLLLPQCEIDWLLDRVPYDPYWSSVLENGPAGTCSP